MTQLTGELFRTCAAHGATFQQAFDVALTSHQRPHRPTSSRRQFYIECFLGFGCAILPHVSLNVPLRTGDCCLKIDISLREKKNRLIYEFTLGIHVSTCNG